MYHFLQLNNFHNVFAYYFLLVANKFNSATVFSLPQPEGCPTALHNYTEKNILNKDPNKRPDFGNIRRKVESIMKK